MNVLSFVLAAMASLVPDGDHTELAADGWRGGRDGEHERVEGASGPVDARVVDYRVTGSDTPRRARIGAATDSICLIASAGQQGVVLAYDGAGIEGSFEAVGSAYFDEHGLDDAPAGLSIWEGSLHVHHINTPDCNEWDYELVGRFRPLTDREWELLRTTGIPWEFEPLDGKDGA